MINFLKKSGNLKHNVLLSYLAITIVFIADLLTAHDYAVWILYLLPLHIAPFRKMRKKHIYMFAAVCSVLIWLGFFFATQGTTLKVALFNRSLMTFFYWVIAYSQLQKVQAFKKLSKSEEKLRDVQEKLQRNQLRFERAEELAHVGSWVMNISSGQLELSDEMKRILGLDPETRSIHISNYLQMVHPDDSKSLAEMASKHHQEGRPVDTEYRIVRPDGKIRYIHGMSGSAGDPSNGTGIRYGAAKDLTERKTVEIALEKERELFESIFNSIPVMLTIYDPEFQSFRFNEAARSITGWSEEEVSDGSFLDKIYPDPERRQEAASFMQSLEPKWKEFLITAKDGTHVESSWYNIRLNSGTQIGIGLDLREAKKAEKILHESQIKLQQSNRELEQFAYVASHDLQEPLRMVSSYLGMLEKKYKNQLDDRAKQYIHYAVDGSKRMSNLIKDLLVYSRVTSRSKEFTEVDLNKVFNDVSQDLKILIKEKDARITSSKLPVIKADPVQMHQLLQNLIGNAIKFNGDRVPEVTIKAKQVKNGWLFSVRDNGIGIDPEYYDKIFQIFQRLHERDKYPGTGIGLAVCKKIVEHHCGRIWVESETGKGTTFYFTISENNNLLSPEELDDIEILSA